VLNIMQITIYNSSKNRLETINLEFTDKNTTWFDDCTDDHDIHMISDVDAGLLITERGYNYPFWIDGASREGIGYSREKAQELIALYMDSP